MLKDKNCEQCGVLISYKEWKEISLTATDRSWNLKRFCSPLCNGRHKHEKNRRRTIMPNLRLMLPALR